MIELAALFLGIVIGYLIWGKPVKRDVGKFTEFQEYK
jgi:hypothetical protein